MRRIRISDERVVISPPGADIGVHKTIHTLGSPTADPGVVSLIPARSHNFVEIDHVRV